MRSDQAGGIPSGLKRSFAAIAREPGDFVLINASFAVLARAL